MMDKAQKEKEGESRKGKDVKQINVGSVHNYPRSEPLSSFFPFLGMMEIKLQFS